MADLTKMWRIKEAPRYEVELTPGAWVLWEPCCYNEDCPKCGGANSRILASCGFAEDGSTTLADPEMISRATGLKSWTPERIQ